MRGQKDLNQWKRESSGSQLKEKNDAKCIKTVNNTFWWKNGSTLGPSIFGTKSHRDKLTFSAERRDQSDWDEA